MTRRRPLYYRGGCRLAQTGRTRLREWMTPVARLLELLVPLVVEPNRLRTVHVNDALPLAPVVSVAVTLAEYVPRTVGVPVMAPLVVLRCSPVGSPVAEYVNVCPVAESVAWI